MKEILITNIKYLLFFRIISKKLYILGNKFFSKYIIIKINGLKENIRRNNITQTKIIVGSSRFETR